MSIIFNSADIAETMNNGVSNVTGADSIITENYTNVVQHGIKIDMSVRERIISGTPPLTFNSNGTPLLDFLISGNMVQSGRPTPDNPIQPNKCGDLETSGAKAGQYKIPISSGEVTTPVYLGEVQTTRRIKKLVLTGEEAFAYSSQDDNRYVCTLAYSTLNMSDAIGICSHFVWKRNYEPTVYNRIARANNTTFYLSLANDLLDEVSTNGFKAYLAAQYAAGTPVTVWYVLATPTTGIVNEPLCKIDNYADTLSMEQAGVTIPTISGNNTLDVQTTLKPSNILITYKGR